MWYCCLQQLSPPADVLGIGLHEVSDIEHPSISTVFRVSLDASSSMICFPLANILKHLLHVEDRPSKQIQAQWSTWILVVEKKLIRLTF